MCILLRMIRYHRNPNTEKGTEMSEILERWKTVAELFSKRLDAVEDEQWEDPTPCIEFSVRQLVEHAIDAQRMVPKALGERGAIDTPNGNDLKATWRAVRAVALAAYSEPGALDKDTDSPLGGTMPAERMVAGPMTADALIHTWDLARAIGADETLPTAACQAMLDALQTMPEEALRQPGRFDGAIDPPEGADIQTQLPCFTGRWP